MTKRFFQAASYRAELRSNGPCHAWSSDPVGQAEIRAAEDGRDGPLPTLEEAIAAVTERRPPEPGGGGNVTGFTEPAKRSAAVSETGEGQSGLRTELVTLEVTHGESFGVSHWSWVTILRLQSGESVRVVEDGDSWRAACESARIASATIADITDERDAAIRERDQGKEFWMGELRSRTAERDAARVRVAEMESAAKLAPTANADAESNHAPAASVLRSVVREMTDIILGNADADEKHSALATLVEAVCPGFVLAPAASGAAGTEPDYYVYKNERGRIVYTSQKLVGDEWAAWTITPLYAAPQPAKGWLTAEEREFLDHHLRECEERAATFSKALALPWFRRMKLIEALLARSSPPEVVLPLCAGWADTVSRSQVKAALAAAGVTVKEVGK